MRGPCEVIVGCKDGFSAHRPARDDRFARQTSSRPAFFQNVGSTGLEPPASDWADRRGGLGGATRVSMRQLRRKLRQERTRLVALVAWLLGPGRRRCFATCGSTS
jgi:hypothetical protein